MEIKVKNYDIQNKTLLHNNYGIIYIATAGKRGRKPTKPKRGRPKKVTIPDE